MTKDEQLSYLEAKINHYASAIPTALNKGDRTALGELHFFIALRCALLEENKQTQEDKNLEAWGMLDAINDFLIKMGHIKKGNKFYQPLTL